MDTNNVNQLNLHNLPPELLTQIFGYSETAELAQNRTICARWRDIIESNYITRMEMYDDNWESYVKNSTASKILLKLNDVKFPIYLAAEFDDFMSRVKILELTGHIPVYNVINILGSRKLQSLTVNDVSLDNYRRLGNFKIFENESRCHLTQLNIGQPDSENEFDLALMICIVSTLLKPNCLKELNIATSFFYNFKPQHVLHAIFAGIFEGESVESEGIIEPILMKQQRSLQLIGFSLPVYDRSPREEPKAFIKFHQYADVSVPPATTAADPTNQEPTTYKLPEIHESSLYLLDHFRFNATTFMESLLQIYAAQSKMRNLEICYKTQAHLDQIGNIIRNNSETLEEITIQTESRGYIYPYQSFSCSSLPPCLKLKKLTLQVEERSDVVTLHDLLRLPTSLETLCLTGFVPTGSSELFEVPGISPYSNLTKVELRIFPWFFLDGNAVEVFEATHLSWLLNLFPKIRKLTLYLSEHSDDDDVPDPVSPEFVKWCLEGGGANMKIDSIKSCRGAHEILIGSDEQ